MQRSAGGGSRGSLVSLTSSTATAGSAAPPAHAALDTTSTTSTTGSISHGLFRAHTPVPASPRAPRSVRSTLVLGGDNTYRDRSSSRASLLSDGSSSAAAGWTPPTGWHHLASASLLACALLLAVLPHAWPDTLSALRRPLYASTTTLVAAAAHHTPAETRTELLRDHWPVPELAAAAALVSALAHAALARTGRGADERRCALRWLDQGLSRGLLVLTTSSLGGLANLQLMLALLMLVLAAHGLLYAMEVSNLLTSRTTLALLWMGTACGLAAHALLLSVFFAGCPPLRRFPWSPLALEGVDLLAFLHAVASLAMRFAAGPWRDARLARVLRRLDHNHLLNNLLHKPAVTAILILGAMRASAYTSD